MALIIVSIAISVLAFSKESDDTKQFSIVPVPEFRLVWTPDYDIPTSTPSPTPTATPSPVPTRALTPVLVPTRASTTPVQPSEGCPRMAYPEQQVWAEMACKYWPEQPLKAIDVGLCETGLSRHPDTFNLNAVHGGPWQISKAVWADWFLANFGWTWEQVVTNPEIHTHAARIIYDRSGGWGPWPVCGK